MIMADYTGSILELKGKKAVVMTDTCDFISIKRQPDMFVGQQIKFKKSEVVNLNKHYTKYFALIASVFLLAFASIFYLHIFSPSSVYAYIDVDINPSLELSIDRDSEVLGVKPLNHDAKALLKDLYLESLPVSQAISIVVEASKKQGYISPGKENAVLISASIEKSNKLAKSDESILDNILAEISNTEYSIDDESLETEIIKVTPDSRKSAVENNISMGRYSLYNDIKKEDDKITVENAKSARVADMIKKAKNNNSNKNKDKIKNKDKDKSTEKNNNGKAVEKPDKTNVTPDNETFNNSNNSKNNKYKDKDKDKTKDKKNNGNNKEASDKNKTSAEITISPDGKDSLDQGSSPIKDSISDSITKDIEENISDNSSDNISDNENTEKNKDKNNTKNNGKSLQNNSKNDSKDSENKQNDKSNSEKNGKK